MIYQVYVKINQDNVITTINSSAFLPNVIIETDGWIKIDEGVGDKYHHAQNNYLEKGLADKNGLYNYKYIDNIITERTVEDKQPELDRINYQNEIIELKNKLLATDYIAAKLAEGAASREDYEEQLAQRATWRFRINELEELLSI